MKSLIVEDDFVSRLLLQEILRRYGDCHIAVNGKEAVQAFLIANEARRPYDLICLDIMMPELDGQATLRAIRAMEEGRGLLAGHGARVIMTTALDDEANRAAALQGQCDAYLLKPIDVAELLTHLRSFGLIR